MMPPRTKATVKATDFRKVSLQMQETQIPSKYELQADARQLRGRHQRWRQSHRPEHLYAYLLSVYRLFRRWQNADVADRAARQLLTSTGISTNRRRHPLRAIIDVTSDADRRTKSRWTRALRYAWRERRRCRGLKQCLEANGGVAGCARSWAELRAARRTPPGFVRVGGEGRFPEVPFFVDVRLLDEHGRW
jgi:hypothetical protein